jgi:hypothetical protein
MTAGIHCLDRLTWLIGSPVQQVSAQLSTRFHDQQADDAGLIFLRYADGAAGTVVSVGYATGAPKHLTELTCTRGMLTIDYVGGVTIGRARSGRPCPMRLPGVDAPGPGQRVRAFVRAIVEDCETGRQTARSPGTSWPWSSRRRNRRRGGAKSACPRRVVDGPEAASMSDPVLALTLDDLLVIHEYAYTCPAHPRRGSYTVCLWFRADAMAHAR